MQDRASEAVVARQEQSAQVGRRAPKRKRAWADKAARAKAAPAKEVREEARRTW
jgi:hypothetical protein